MILKLRYFTWLKCSFHFQEFDIQKYLEDLEPFGPLCSYQAVTLSVNCDSMYETDNYITADAPNHNFVKTHCQQALPGIGCDQMPTLGTPLNLARCVINHTVTCPDIFSV